MTVDHIGIAVKNLTEALPRWEHMLGATASPPERVESQKVQVAFLEAGGTHLEFLEPTEAESGVGRFLEKRGEGIHHIAFRVASVDHELSELAARGARVIDSVSRPGARGARVGFAHPSAFGGVLVEFVERPR
jgi:methylmalonyl-CoA/ethylmalonyl-CoA epimerase